MKPSPASPLARTGHPIKRRREELGMKLLEVAKLAGISEAELSLVERGLRDPKIETKVKVSRVLGREVHVLFPPTLLG